MMTLLMSVVLVLSCNPLIITLGNTGHKGKERLVVGKELTDWLVD